VHNVTTIKTREGGGGRTRKSGESTRKTVKVIRGQRADRVGDPGEGERTTWASRSKVRVEGLLFRRGGGGPTKGGDCTLVVIGGGRYIKNRRGENWDLQSDSGETGSIPQGKGLVTWTKKWVWYKKYRMKR